jgi:hypothetical protein
VVFINLPVAVVACSVTWAKVHHLINARLSSESTTGGSRKEVPCARLREWLPFASRGYASGCPLLCAVSSVAVGSASTSRCSCL